MQKKPGSIFANENKLFLLVLIWRVLNSLLVWTYFNPDEFWQSLEVAHRMVFGYGYLTWEWREALRSYLHPLLFAGLYKALHWCGLDNPLSIIWGPRILQGLFAAIGDFYLYKLANKYLGPRTAKWALICQLFSWFMFYCIVRTYSNSIETVLTTIILYYWPWPPSKDSTDHRIVSLLFMALCVLIRPTSALYLGSLGLFYTLFVLKSFNQIVRFLLTEVLPIGILALLLEISVNYLFYERLTFIPYNFFYFNIVKDVGSYYGVHPWHWYFTNGFPAIMGSFVPFFILGVFKSKKYHLFYLIIFVLCVYSLLAHKEFRFVLPMLPLSFIYAGHAIQEIELKYSSINGPSLSKLLVYFTLLINIPISLYLSLVHQIGPLSVLSYIRDNIHDNETIQFLMPCHSTPFYSHIHRNLSMGFWDCSPSDEPGYIDQADQFFENPSSYLIQHYKNENSLPNHFILFSRHLDSILPFLVQKQYVKTTEFFHSHSINWKGGLYINSEKILVFSKV